MKLIVITLPNFFPGEAEAITTLFRYGLEILHLRKPEANLTEIVKLLDQIPEEYHSRIVIHEHFQLVNQYNLKGIHLNRRNPNPPQDYKGNISCSCHTLNEVQLRKPTCNYVFLSPIYDSISKTGYSSAFTICEIQKAQQQGIIDSHVMALGGINASRLNEVKQLGFGGAALLGDVWNHLGADFVPHFLRLRQETFTPVILSIAGSDCSGGAGIQADTKTISALGGYAATVITAVTAQNTQGVQAIYPQSEEIVRRQIESVMDDLTPHAIKIGMVHDVDIVTAIADCLKTYRPKHIVYDPVMISTSGRRLMTEKTVQEICEKLFPLCDLITPNLHETALLTSKTINSINDMEQAAQTLAHHYGISVLVKGGHLEGDKMFDVLFHQENTYHYVAPKIESHNLHGTGCTLSSAIATQLAYGISMEQAVKQAKQYTYQAINRGKNMQIGHGNGPLWHFF